MSYINDALRKVQKEKESRYVAYGHIVSAPGKKSEQPKRWLSIIGILIVFFFAAGIIALLYWPEDKKVTVTPATALVRTPVVAKAIIVPAKSQIVKETTADRKNIAALKKETAAPEIKVKQEIAESKALFAQALDRQREGKLEEAKILYRKVVKIDQHNLQAFNNLGVIYMGEKKYKRAIMRFNDAIKIKHDYPDAHYNLACLYAKKKLCFPESALSEECH